MSGQDVNVKCTKVLGMVIPPSRTGIPYNEYIKYINPYGIGNIFSPPKLKHFFDLQIGPFPMYFVGGKTSKVLYFE